MAQPIPHSATISYAFATRFHSGGIEQVFAWIPEEVNNAGHLDPSVVFTDGTRSKANASLKKHIRKAIPKTARHYEARLTEEVNQDWEAHDPKPFDGDPKPPKEKTVCELCTTVSIRASHSLAETALAEADAL